MLLQHANIPLDITIGWRIWLLIFPSCGAIVIGSAIVIGNNTVTMALRLPAFAVAIPVSAAPQSGAGPKWGG